MSKTVRNTLIAAAVVVVLVLALPFLIPLDAYRGRIEATAEHATGRTLTISGPLRIMLFPHLGLRAESVTLANVPGGRATALAQVGDIRLSLKVLPLLTGHIALDRIVLDKPVIALEVDAAGNPNWKFTKQKTAAQQTSSVSLPSGAEFAGLEIRDGRITYDNARTAIHRAVDHVNVEVAITRIDEPASLTGDLEVGGQKIGFDARLSTLKTLLAGGATALHLAARSEIMQAGFDGVLKPEGGADGNFSLDSTSLRTLAAAFGEALPGRGFNGLSFRAKLASNGKLTRFDPVRLTLDGQHIAGRLSLDRGSQVPVIDGVLVADRLDLNPYLAGSGAERETGPARRGWSRSPISFAILKKIDGQLEFDTGALRLRGLKLARTTLKLALSGGTLAARLDPVALYGGSGSAEFDIDDRGSLPRLRGALAFRHVALRPFLDDTLGIESIEGLGELNLAVTSQGSNADAIMHALSGKGAISAGQGRFRHVDLGRIARSITSVFGGAAGEGASTDFHAMGADFVIAGGVLTSTDFHLAGPLLQMTGQGQIDIGGRAISFRLVPAAGIAGVSLGVPFRVHGSWDQVQYGPDVAGIVGGVVQNVESGGAAIKGMLGGDNASQNGNKKKRNAGDALKDLFGLH